MNTNISVTLVKNEKELVDIMPLAQAYQEEINQLTGTDQQERAKENFSENKSIDELLLLQGVKTNFWIAREGNKAIGFTCGSGEYKHYELERIYTSKEYRKRGIGEKLEQAQREYAKNNGFEKISAAVYKDNYPLIQILKRAGFSFKEIGCGYHTKLNLKEVA